MRLIRKVCKAYQFRLPVSAKSFSGRGRRLNPYSGICADYPRKHLRLARMLQPSGYERAELAGKVNDYWHFRASAMTYVRVWLRDFIGYLLVEPNQSKESSHAVRTRAAYALSGSAGGITGSFTNRERVAISVSIVMEVATRSPRYCIQLRNALKPRR